MFANISKGHTIANHQQSVPAGSCAGSTTRSTRGRAGACRQSLPRATNQCTFCLAGTEKAARATGISRAAVVMYRWLYWQPSQQIDHQSVPREERNEAGYQNQNARNTIKHITITADSSSYQNVDCTELAVTAHDVPDLYTTSIRGRSKHTQAKQQLNQSAHALIYTKRSSVMHQYTLHICRHLPLESRLARSMCIAECIPVQAAMHKRVSLSTAAHNATIT